MTNILDQIVAKKKVEISAARARVPQTTLVKQIADCSPAKDFLGALTAQSGVSLIAEVKKASPSKGVIRADFHPVSIAKDYEAAGASCVSVLTDESFFQGHLDFLSDIRQAIDLPLLRKDFIIDSYQVLEARVAGADAVLLIAECLTTSALRELHDQIVALGMTPLVEFFEPSNLQAVLDAGAQLVGINNRNLNTFETKLEHCLKLRTQIPPDRVVVGESGIYSADDVRQLADAKIDAMLVGESLMRRENIREAVTELLK